MGSHLFCGARKDRWKSAAPAHHKVPAESANAINESAFSVDGSDYVLPESSAQGPVDTADCETSQEDRSQFGIGIHPLKQGYDDARSYAVSAAKTTAIADMGYR